MGSFVETTESRDDETSLKFVDVVEFRLSGDGEKQTRSEGRDGLYSYEARLMDSRDRTLETCASGADGSWKLFSPPSRIFACKASVPHALKLRLTRAAMSSFLSARLRCAISEESERGSEDDERSTVGKRRNFKFLLSNKSVVDIFHSRHAQSSPAPASGGSMPVARSPRLVALRLLGRMAIFSGPNDFGVLLMRSIDWIAFSLKSRHDSPTSIKHPYRWLWSGCISAMAFSMLFAALSFTTL